MIKKVVYVEPADYFPLEIRKEFKLGEYAESEETEKTEKEEMDIEDGYFSEDTRKKFKLGEYAQKDVDAEIKVTVETKDCTMKAEGIEEVGRLIESLDNE